MKVNTIIKNDNYYDSSKNIEELFLDTKLDDIFKLDLNNVLKHFNNNCYFAIRSSGNVYIKNKFLKEDSKINSFSGQYESFLKVSKKNIEYAIKKCWASLFNERSLRRFNVKENKEYLNSKMTCILQEMVYSDKSAIIMTKDPLEFGNILGIEATYGFCESLVSGKVTGDFYLFDKDTNNKLIFKNKGSKKYKIEYF